MAFGEYVCRALGFLYSREMAVTGGSFELAGEFPTPEVTYCLLRHRPSGGPDGTPGEPVTFRVRKGDLSAMDGLPPPPDGCWPGSVRETTGMTAGISYGRFEIETPCGGCVRAERLAESQG